MTIIYTPKGKAREYSPLAVNLYTGCSHHCEYCYAPRTLKMERSKYDLIPAPRKGVIAKLEKEVIYFKGKREQVLFSFIGDPYGETLDGNAATRKALQLFLDEGWPVAVLTKGGARCLKDIDIFKEFGEHIQVGASLTFWSEALSRAWEPNAAIPEERLETLSKLKKAGIKTFASFEPVISTDESIKLIEKTLEQDNVDAYKIGKLNDYKGLDKEIDWNSFLTAALSLLRGTGKQIYIKKDLREVCKGIPMSVVEMTPDLHAVT